jgi:hypothetical protein
MRGQDLDMQEDNIRSMVKYILLNKVEYCYVFICMFYVTDPYKWTNALTVVKVKRYFTHKFNALKSKTIPQLEIQKFLIKGRKVQSYEARIRTPDTTWALTRRHR